MGDEMSTGPEREDPTGTRAGRIAQNVAALLRARLGQARREGKAALRRLAVGVVLGLIALVVALLAVPLLVALLILVLALVLPAWLATATALLAMLATSGVLLLLARRRLRWVTPRFVADLREDWQAIRRRLEERP